MSTTSPMSMPAYVATVFAPSCLFMLLSIPVKKKNVVQEAILALLWFTELSIPIYYAGQFSYICLISTAVWAWASSMKMGVWVFSMSMEERRQRAFIYTLSDWRKRLYATTPNTAVEPQTKPRPDEYIKVPLGRLLFDLIKHQLAFDAIDLLFKYGDSNRPVIVFSAFLSKMFSLIGQTSTAESLAPPEPLTYSTIMMSILLCMLFCVYLQMQLQAAFDSVMLGYALIYKALPKIEMWLLGEDSKKLNSKNIAKTKAILRRVRGVRALKSYIEETLNMPPLFDSPWSAHSLRDFWGRQWHTFYNNCFYRLGYRPIRWTVQLLFNCKPPRWLPALAVFVMSGIMHEYFLYAATGSSVYFGSPLPACGIQFLFFVIQVVGIGFGDQFFRRGVLGHLYTLVYMAITSHMFVVPYIITGYIHMDRFSFYRIAIDLCNSGFMKSILQ
ncbi:unnamed protein product [Mucor hiemalis]